MAEPTTPGLKGIRNIESFDLKGQRVFIRVDFNVPLKHAGNKQNGAATITDDTRIRAALPTIKYALDHGAKVVLASHLGRPEKKEDRAKYSMEPVARHLSELLKLEVILVDDPASDAPKGLLPGLKPTQLIMLENLRYDAGETGNSRELALQMASYTDVYINDAFGACHRAHASIEALPKAIENRGIGFLVQKEIECLDLLTHKPAAPYMAILGGAKVSDKIPVIEKLIDLIDVFLIGGAMAYTFLAAQGRNVGSSKVEKDKLAFAKEMLARVEARGKRMILPIDHLIVPEFQSNAFKINDGPGLPDGMMGLDIGPKSTQLFRNEISRAKTVFWNGPMGVFERAEFSKGTFGVAEALAAATEAGAKTIVGGGDSAAAAEASGFASRMSHISTGGGASLEYLQGDKLPGLEVLRRLRVGATPTLEGAR